METTAQCESCGMPMREKSEFGGRDLKNRYCCYCTDETGTLKPYQAVLEGMTAFSVKMQGLDPDQARLAAIEHLAKMPAWIEAHG